MPGQQSSQIAGLLCDFWDGVDFPRVPAKHGTHGVKIPGNSSFAIHDGTGHIDVQAKPVLIGTDEAALQHLPEERLIRSGEVVIWTHAVDQPVEAKADTSCLRSRRKLCLHRVSSLLVILDPASLHRQPPCSNQLLDFLPFAGCQAMAMDIPPGPDVTD